MCQSLYILGQNNSLNGNWADTCVLHGATSTTGKIIYKGPILLNSSKNLAFEKLNHLNQWMQFNIFNEKMQNNVKNEKALGPTKIFSMSAIYSTPTAIDKEIQSKVWLRVQWFNHAKVIASSLY